MGLNRLLVAIFALLLSAPLCAQENSDPSANGPALQQPSLKPVVEAIARAGFGELHTRVRIEWDSSGKVLEAIVDPSTHVRRVDEAIHAYAMQVQLTPGKAGSDWLPIDFSSH